MHTSFRNILATKPLLIAEFVFLFIGAPLVLAFALPPRLVLPLLWIWTAIGLMLLHFTPGFSWRFLRFQLSRQELIQALGLGAFTLIWSIGFTWILFPERLFALPKQAPMMWLLIMILYPLLSALPQELIFRVLYYRRFKSLLNKSYEPVLNAVIFSMAHILYQNLMVSLMTFVGGYIFARVYLNGHFWKAVAFHAIAGNMIFTSGLGYLFYSGNV